MLVHFRGTSIKMMKSCFESGLLFFFFCIGRSISFVKEKLPLPRHSTILYTNRIEKKLKYAKEKRLKREFWKKRSSKQSEVSRKREFEIVDAGFDLVFGIDEAGRGSIAGPVVISAVHIPRNATIQIEGLKDSKQINEESERERIFNELMLLEKIKWSTVLVSPQRIDELNIQESILQGMSEACSIMTSRVDSDMNRAVCGIEEFHYDDKGIYFASNCDQETNIINAYALIDGNQVPKSISCEAEAITGGDGSEACIAAASIISKVTLDRIMNEYAMEYNNYNFNTNKGYKTLSHVKAIRTWGCLRIHRKTFDPIKFMSFDENGKLVSEKIWKRGRMKVKQKRSESNK